MFKNTRRKKRKIHLVKKYLEQAVGRTEEDLMNDCNFTTGIIIFTPKRNYKLLNDTK